MSGEKKEAVSRRGFMKTAATGIVGLAVGAGIGYGAASMAPGAKPGATVTVTGPGAGMQYPFNLPRKGTTIAERAIDAAKFLIEQNPQWKGTELFLACVGGYENGFNAMKGRWEQATGIKITPTPVPLPEYFDKMMVEAVSKTGNIDLVNGQTMYIPDFAESGLLYQLDDVGMWLDIRERGRPDGFIYPVGDLVARYKGKLWGFLQDADIQLLYYRKDLLSDPKEGEKFEKQYGYKLAPPQTFKAYRDICEFFTRPPDLFGHCEGRELTRNAFTFFLYLNAKKWPNFYYFNENMEPQLLQKECVEAANLYVETTKFAPKNQPELTGLTSYQSMAEGRTVFTMAAPSVARILNDPKSFSKDKWSCAPIPGYIVDTPAGKVLSRRSVNLASWALGVSNHSKKKELACCFAAFACDTDSLVDANLAGGTWHDPARYTQVGASAPARLIENRGAEVLIAVEQNAGILTPMVSGIRGATEYNLTMSKNLHAAMTGGTTVDKALQDTVKAWNDVTERLGRQVQIAGWKEMMKFYPTVSG